MMLNVKVIYPDDTFSVRNLEEQIKSLEDETLQFRTWFLWELLYNKKQVPTRFGWYELTNEETTE